MVIKQKLMLSTKHFYQSVRVILRAWRKTKGLPFANWSFSGLHLKSSLSLTATESSVSHLRYLDEFSPFDYELTVNDFGLLGTHGSMPHSYTEWISEQVYRYNDNAIQEFVDIFNHRINVIRFELWKKTHLIAAKELDPEFSFPSIFNAISCAGHAGNPVNTFIRPDNVSLWGRRTLSNLTRLLEREFHCLVSIIPFQGTWVDVPPTAICILGNNHTALGLGAGLGKKYWDIHSSFHVRIGPLKVTTCLANQQAKLKYILSSYCWQNIEFTSEFLIAKIDMNNLLNGSCQLGSSAGLGDAHALKNFCVKYRNYR